jgi:hypothetical protein
MYERHLRVEGEPVASTRYRDLADLLLISQSSQVDGAAVQAALQSEVARRTALGKVVLTLPERFEVPDPATWELGYPPGGEAGHRAPRLRHARRGDPRRGCVHHPTAVERQPWHVGSGERSLVTGLGERGSLVS